MRKRRDRAKVREKRILPWRRAPLNLSAVRAGPSQRQLGLIILLGGVILLLISALADPLGIGGGGKFGGKQIAGVAVGAVGVLVGALLVIRSRGVPAGDGG
jgi:hypothetical protein